MLVVAQETFQSCSGAFEAGKQAYFLLELSYMENNIGMNVGASKNFIVLT